MDGSTSAPTASDELALEIGREILALAGRIPRLEAPHPSNAKWVRGARTVSQRFILAMIAMVESSEELQRAGTFDVDEAREMLQFNSAFRSLADRFAFLLASVTYSMELRKAKVVAAAMITYAVAKGLARDPGSAGLTSHLEILRRELGRKNGSKG